MSTNESAPAEPQLGSGAVLGSSVSEQEFAEMVKRHDLTYQYADGRPYWRGVESIDRIRVARKDLPWPVARSIWNAEVDRKIAAHSREQFYWPEKEPE